MLTPARVLLSIGFVVVALAVILASALMARTPRSTIEGALIPTPAPGIGGTVRYTLPDGASAGDVGRDLEELGVIRSSRQFEVLVSLMGVQNQLSAGLHELPRGVSMVTVVNLLLVQDSVPTVRITFPEGIRIEEMAEIVEESGFATADEFLEAVAKAVPAPSTAATIPEGHGLQGYLFPDTYILPVESPVSELVQLMLQTFELKVDAEIRAAAEEQGLDLHQLITLASIVEREAVVADERPIIAGVFLNRMRAGDRLDADPTVQFAVAEDPENVAEFGWWKKELTITDLETPSPYNTRLFPGLPPGPIANPSLESIKAVAFAPPTDFYYFVADAIKEDGSHVFAVTLAEHEANVQRMQQAQGQ